MSFFYDVKREQKERNRKSSPEERGRTADPDRDGDSRRSRSGREGCGPEEF